MNDDRLRELLSDYVEGNLPDDQAAEVRAALEQAPAMKAEAQALRETMTALSGLHELHTPDIASRVEKTIHRRSKGRFFGDEPWVERLPIEWISLVVIGLLLVTVLFFVMRDDKPVSIRPGKHVPGKAVPGKAAPKTPTKVPRPPAG